MDVRHYLEADGYIISINLKEDMMIINIQKPTEQELRTFTTIKLTSELPRNPG